MTQSKTQNRRFLLASRPTSWPEPANFRLVSESVPAPGPKEVLVRALWLSVDPYMRGRMSAAKSYARPVEVCEVMTGGAVGQVVNSNHPAFKPGDIVEGSLGWQDYAVVDASLLRKIDPKLAPIQTAVGVLGMPGMTAYFALLEVCRPKAGDTVVVSGAAGAVGQIVGQIAKLTGCRTVGIAGGPDKATDCKLYGYDVAIDYKNDDVRASLKEACPDGVDVYFDNVGGEISAAVHGRLNVGARIAICGQVSQYNAVRPEPSFHPGLLIVYRAKMQGFLVSDYAPRFDEAARRLARWVAEGKLQWREDVTDGLENAPSAFLGMLRGENRGKALVKVAGRS